MSQRAKDLAERLWKFNDEVVAFVERCSEEDLRKVCTFEDWSVGVTARHIGAGHYNIIGLVKMIINGEKFPGITGEQVNRNANEHAREHADCTKPEILDVLHKGGHALIGFVGALDDSQLNQSALISMMGKDMTAREFLETVVLFSAGEHFKNMRAAAASGS